MMQERSCRSFDVNFFSALKHVQPVESLDRRLGLAFGGAERREVVITDQSLRSVVHGGCIQRHRHMPDMAIVQGRRAAAIENAIKIMATRGGKTGMKFTLRLRRDPSCIIRSVLSPAL